MSNKPPAPVWQFSLRSLLVLTLVVAATCGLWRWFDPFGVAALGWIAVLILAHVAGNRWGSQTYRLPPEHSPLGDSGVSAPRAQASGSNETTLQCVAATHGELAALQAVSLGRASHVCAACGGVLGACLAGWATLVLTPPTGQAFALAVAATSAAVLAAGLGFLVGSFVEMSLHYLKQGLGSGRSKG